MKYRIEIAIVVAIALIGALLVGCTTQPSPPDTFATQQNIGASPPNPNAASVNGGSNADLTLVTTNDTDIGEMI